MSHDEPRSRERAGEDVQKNAALLPPRMREKRSDGSLLLYLIVAGGIVLLVRVFIAAPYLVSGPSMNDTFHDHDYLIVDRLSYGLCMPAVPVIHSSQSCLPVGDPQRGDVIVFAMPVNPGETLIKRVIGLPGDTVVLRGDTVTIKNARHPEGFTLAETYVSRQNEGGPSNETITLAPGHYFVMGDNRAVSYDSRSWGTLPREDIIGRVLVRLYPFDEVGFVPGEARYSSQ